MSVTKWHNKTHFCFFFHTWC